MGQHMFQISRAHPEVCICQPISDHALATLDP